ncbi:ABC transporter permease [Geosporobacter ferrireducens]|uniref:ABC transporter permease n=1 Tax=Geosporobacter ferrireducens TaxID=1424294 RepID=UPI00139E2C12|nr:ABC transporter permease [Geosporobacter ferrireducens]MTI55869.1 ABC transporter permease [Geosporobacter ferrireducens]
MNKGKAVWIVTFSGILLMLSFLILGNALVEECNRLNGDYSMQKVLVSVKNQIDRQGKNSFSMEDIERLKKELSTEAISYTAQSGLVNTPVSSAGTALPARLTGVDRTYPVFNSLMLKDGSFITQKQEEEGAMVAVIDEELAWELFRTVHATGKTIDIFDKTFQITGIVKKDNSLIGKLTDDGLPKVYIPAEVMMEMDTTAGVTALQIKTVDAGTLDQNKNNVSNALRQIGKDPSNYNIIDYNLKYEFMKQWPLLFVFILGAVSMMILLTYAKKRIKTAYFLIRNGCKTDYFSNVMKDNKRVIGIHILEIVLAALGILLIWREISFRPYIPPRYIPDEIINISYYLDIIKNGIQGSIRNMGYIPDQAELIVNVTNMLLYLLFYTAVVLGFLLLYTGFREMKALNMDSNKLTRTFGIFFVLALAIVAAAAYMIKLPFVLDLKGILIAWVFIFLNILSITKGKESDIQNV